MSKNKHQCPWDLAYEQNKDRYTKEQIDEMLFCEIQELIHQEMVELDYETFENIIVSATESGSFWQYFVYDFSLMTDRYLTQNVNDIAKYLWHDESAELMIDTNGQEYIVTYDSVRENMQLAYEKYEYHVNQFLKGQGDSTNADVIFQVLVMGEVNYG